MQQLQQSRPVPIVNLTVIKCGTWSFSCSHRSNLNWIRRDKLTFNLIRVFWNEETTWIRRPFNEIRVLKSTKTRKILMTSNDLKKVVPTKNDRKTELWIASKISAWPQMTSRCFFDQKKKGISGLYYFMHLRLQQNTSSSWRTSQTSLLISLKKEFSLQQRLQTKVTFID